MPFTLRADGSTGRVAIFKGNGTNLAAFNNPLNNLNLIKFHSSLDYPKVIDERSFSVVLPLRRGTSNASLTGTATYNLFQHGRAGIPAIIGMTYVNGYPVGFHGTVPVQTESSPQFGSDPMYARFLSLGADSAWVRLHEYAPRAGDTGIVTSQRNNYWNYYPAMTLNVTVWVLDELL